MAASRQLTVGFDLGPLRGPAGGIGRYTGELYAALVSSMPPGTIVPIAGGPLAGGPIAGGPLAGAAWTPLRAVWTFGLLPRRLERSAVNCFHATSFYAPFSGSVPTVVTVHDLSVYACPEHHPRGRVLRARAMLPRVVGHAAAVITPTHAVRADVLRIFGLPPHLVHVVPEAAAPVFARKPNAGERQELLASYGLEPGFFLSLGTIEPRKNLARVIDAVARLRDSGRIVRLVIAGRSGWKTAPAFDRVRELRLADQVRCLGYVPDRDLPVLMDAADALVYPSLFEGFGLPVLEAMAAGLPVVTSFDGALAEVAGDAAMLVDPKDTDAIAAAMEGVLEPQTRARLIERGTARAAQFSWQRAAKETADVYRLVAGRRAAAA